MTGDMLFVLVVVAVAGALFVSGRMRLDVVALSVALSLVLGGVLTAPEALAGFGNPVVIMVAGLLVISDMLARTGVAHHIGRWLAEHARDSEVRLIVLLSLAVGVVGSFMTNTAVVAIFLPIVQSLANKTNLNASRLLLPLAYAGSVSGMLTLIATAPNVLVSAELEQSGAGPFGFFAFTPIGGAVLVVLVVYMLLVGRHFLPGRRVVPPQSLVRTIDDLVAEFGLQDTAHRVSVPVGSPLVGQTLAGAELGSKYDVRVVVLERTRRFARDVVATPAPEVEIRAGDTLVLHGARDRAEQLAADMQLPVLATRATDRERWLQEVGIAKVLIHPESNLIGRTLRAIGLRSIHGVQVLAVRRGGTMVEGFLDEKLQSGDAMLVVGSWKRIQQLRNALHDFVVLALPAEFDNVAPASNKAPVALAILLLMVALSAFEVVPVVVAVLIAGLLAVLTRCLSMPQSYGAIQWSAVVLIAGMMSVTLAMTKTGTAALVADLLVAGLGASSPYVMLSVLFALTSVMSMALSNAATALLLAPVAIRVAQAMEVAPHPFAMTVAIACSAGFVMPVSSPAMMLVVEPGKYTVADFVKVGVPMLVLTWIVTVLLVPVLHPF